MAGANNPMIRPPADPDTLPSISIVTPCFNHVDYVDAALRSVIQQDYPKLEYVVMDGGSTDGSAKVIEGHADKLAHWQSEKDDGQYAAINAGFERTSGEVMAWLNSDDMYHRNALWTVGEIFRTFPEVEWLIGAITGYDAHGRTIWVHQPKPWSRLHFLRRGGYGYMQQESVFWRRSLWERAGPIDTSWSLAADFELWMRFFRATTLYEVNALVGGFRYVAGQRSDAQRDEYDAEVKRILAHEPVSEEDQDIIRKMKRYERWFRPNPVLRRIKTFRRRYKALYGPPRMIDFDPKTNRFVHGDPPRL